MVRTDPFSLSNNAIRTIVKDREGGMWVGTFYGGLNYLPYDNKPFEKFYPTGLPGSLNGNVIRAIIPDNYGNIWIGCEDAGLYRFDPSSRKFEIFSDRIQCRNVQGLLVDNDILWIGTIEKGIYTMDIRTGRIINHFIAGQGNGLISNSFITFLKTSDGSIFAGSQTGVYSYNRNTSTFRFMEDVAPGFFIHDLLEDSYGIIWVGTYGGGLYRFDRSSGICRRITQEFRDPDTGNRFITSIFEDNHQSIWFTTEGNGFSYIDGNTGAITRYVPGNNIDLTIYCAMLQDGSGNLWVSSARGLLKIDQSPDSITLYTKEDGLLDNTFSYNSAYKDRNGKMYFGTMSGLISFNPSDIKPSTYNPPVYFTGLQVNGKEFFNNTTGNPGFRSALVTEKISLKHHQSSLSIDFVSPGFTSPGLTRYKYRMEGSDPDWVMITGNRRVYYTNLSPGEYFFRVQSSADGMTWNNAETTLRIRISPALWLSIPALVIYLFLISALLYLIFSFYHKKNALEQQRKIDIIDSGKEKELLNAKINFFTNITHEVRTPLTLIKGPLDRILKSGLKGSKETEENLLIIKRSTERLLNLTNQLLDFRKTEKEMFSLNFIKTDICELIQSTFHLFQTYAAERLISFRFHSPVNHFELAVDREAITKIISNLLSNALRYADARVDLYIEPRTEKEDIFRVRVVNDGKLISAALTEKIFEPFYQIDFDKPGEKGAGLGLSLARSLAELHHGKLYYDISEKKLNSFVLELTMSQPETITSIREQENVSNADQYEEYEVFGSLENTMPNILLVEDEIEMGKYISEELSGDYNVILTHNGAQALEALRKFNIILVVSDVIMPVMNGYDLCRQIKSNIEFSHIPVILLTATIHLNARIEGLGSGADAYIEKPFSTELLHAQIVNLIKNRSLERQNFINSPLTHFRSVALNKTDEEFLKKLHTTITDNISENDLSVERVAELMGVSVSTLYRKVKALTDLNTVEFIRLTKLKKAAELLSEGSFRINEISFLVGFSSPSYFATSFQKQFGISPSQFVKKLK